MPDRMTHQGSFLRINMPDMFADSAFMDYLNDSDNNIATWHLKSDPNAHEYSDCFVTYDAGEGSHTNMPEKWWNLICEIVEKEMGRPDIYVLLHLTNLDV